MFRAIYKNYDCWKMDHLFSAYVVKLKVYKNASEKRCFSEKPGCKKKQQQPKTKKNMKIMKYNWNERKVQKLSSKRNYPKFLESS